MTDYKNLSGNSGVAAFDIGSDSITVRFHFGDRYVYTYASAGPQRIEIMKSLALSGSGLCTYISTEVRELYERKVADGDFATSGNHNGKFI